MIETLFSFGKLTISTFGVFSGLAFLVFSFTLWQRLRDDFEEEKILSLTILLALFFLLGARLFYILTHFGKFGLSFSWLSFRSSPGFSLLGGFLAAIFILYWWSRQNDWDFWQVSDATVFAFSFSFFSLALGIFISKTDQASLYLLIFSFFFLVVVFTFVQTYRKFIWYQSGKPGFVASVSLSLFSLGYLIVEFLTKNGIFYSWESLGFVLSALAGFSLLYYRSERVLSQDWQGAAAAFSRLFKKRQIPKEQTDED